MYFNMILFSCVVNNIFHYETQKFKFSKEVLIFTNTANSHVKSLNFHGKTLNFHA